MTVNVPLLPRQGSGSSSDPYSQLVSPSLTIPISTSPPSSAQSSSTPTRPTDPQSSSSSSSPTSSSTTFSSITSSTSASSPDDPSSTSSTSSTFSTSSSVIVSSSMATSSSFSSPSSSLPTLSPSNNLPSSSTNTPASSTPPTSVTGTGFPRSLTATMASSSTATASPPPSSTVNEPPPLSSTNNPTTPTSSSSLPTSTGTTSDDPVGGNLSNTRSSAITTTSTSAITDVGGSNTQSGVSSSSTQPGVSSSSTQPGVSSSSTQPGVSSSSTQPGFLVTDRSSDVTASATSSSSNLFSLTGPITFTTTNPAGSTFTTVPDFFTTVFVTTRADGEPMTISQIVINPTGILSPGENRSQNEFFRNKGAVAGVFLVVGLTATAIVVLGILAIWKRRKARRQRDVDLATGAKGASRARSPLEPDEAGQDPGIYAVAVRHSPVDTRSGAPGAGEESSASFGYGPSVFGSGILLNPPAQATNAGVPPEQQPHHYYPYLSSGRRSSSPGEEHPSFTRGPANSSNAPPGYFSASHSYSRMKTPSPVLGGPLVSVQDSSTNHIRGPPPSAYNGVIFSDSKQPSSEGHGSSVENRLGPGLESTDTPSGTVALPSIVAYAYEPEPVTWDHRIVGASPVSDTRASSPRNLQVSTVEQQQDLQSNRGSISNRSASVYSQDWEAEPDVRPTLRVVNDPRISPELGMRLRGGLASEHSFGPRDDEDWSRRVGAQMIANDSTLQVANPAETHRPAE